MFRDSNVVNSTDPFMSYPSLVRVNGIQSTKSNAYRIIGDSIITEEINIGSDNEYHSYFEYGRYLGDSILISKFSDNNMRKIKKYNSIYIYKRIKE